MTKDELDKRFSHHAPKSETVVAAHAALRLAARVFAEILDQNCPESREKSLAVTALEESLMWASDAVARNQPKG